MAALFRVVPAIPITADMLAASNVAEDDHAAWSGAATYGLGDRVIKAHRIWESAQAGNMNHDPETDDGTWWLNAGPTNRHKMFDGAVGIATQNADSIEVTLTGESRITDIAFQNLTAAEVEIEMYDSGDTLVFSHTEDLSEAPYLTSHFEWLFTTPVRRGDFFKRLPPYRNWKLVIRINDPGGTAKCGDLIIGKGFDIGTTQWRYELANYDFSDFEEDAFGQTNVIERPSVRLGTFEVILDRAFESELQRRLATLRATLALYVALPDTGAAQILGFYQRARTVGENLKTTRLAIDIRGVASVAA